MKSRIQILLALALLFASCGKDNASTPTPNNPNQPGNLTCKPVKVDLATDFDLSDTSPYSYSISYNGSSIQSLTRSVSSTQYDYKYNAALPVKRDKTVSGVSKGVDSFFFNTSNSIDLLKHYENGTLYDAIKWQYSSSRLTKKEFTHYGSSITTAYNTYVVANNNVSKVERYTSGGTMYDNYMYAYGAQENKLYKQNKLIDLFLHMDEDMESIVYDALLNSESLVEKIIYTEVGKSTITYNITYDMNNNGYPVQVKSNGKTIITFEYDCK